MKMNMKKKLKDISPTAKVYMKNLYLFKLYLLRKKGFIEMIRELLIKWRPNIENIQKGEFIRDEIDYKTVQKMEEMKFAAARQLEALEKDLSSQKRQELTEDVNNFLRSFNLGQEWHYPTKLLLVTGFFRPPSMNFGISADDGPKDCQRLRLELNPDTSIEDIKMHWSFIRNCQKGLCQKFKKINLSDKKFENMGIALKDLELSSRREFSQLDPEKVSFSRYKAYDLDLAGNLWQDEEDTSEEADRKRRNKLRQIRRRFKQEA